MTKTEYVEKMKRVLATMDYRLAVRVIQRDTAHVLDGLDVKIVNEIISVLAKNPKGSFSMEMPDTAKSFLSGVLRSGNTGQKKSGMPPGATHIVPGSDGKQHYTDGQNDLGVVE